MRYCGNCALCCKLPESPRGEPMFKWCESCNVWRVTTDEPVCRIYENRPETCRQFICLWLAEKIPLQYFPADCGVLVFYTGNEFVAIWEWKIKTSWRHMIECLFCALAEEAPLIMSMPDKSFRIEKTSKPASKDARMFINHYIIHGGK